jgi:hypothetical protein
MPAMPYSRASATGYSADVAAVEIVREANSASLAISMVSRVGLAGEDAAPLLADANLFQKSWG